MSKPLSRPWEYLPRKDWTAKDYRAARKAGWLPPMPQPNFDQPIKPLHGEPEAVLTGGLFGGDPHQDAERRRRRVDQLLEQHGVKPPRPL
jgi:hypothetical protein